MSLLFVYRLDGENVSVAKCGSFKVDCMWVDEVSLLLFDLMLLISLLYTVNA